MLNLKKEADMTFQIGDLVTRKTPYQVYKVLDNNPGDNVRDPEVEMIELATIEGETMGYVAASGFVKASKDSLKKCYLELCLEKALIDAAIALVQGEIAKL